VEAKIPALLRQQRSRTDPGQNGVSYDDYIAAEMDMIISCSPLPAFIFILT